MNKQDFYKIFYQKFRFDLQKKLKKLTIDVYLNKKNNLFFMSLEITVFTFKIIVLFEEWAAVYDSEEKIKLNKDIGITCLYKGVKR